MGLEQAWVRAEIDELRHLTLEEQVTHLFCTLRDSLYRYLLALLGSSGEAEEIAQDAFLKLYEHLQAGHRIARPRCWIFRIAHNSAIDTTRSRKFTTPSRRHILAYSEKHWPAIPRLIPRSESLEPKSLSALSEQCLRYLPNSVCAFSYVPMAFGIAKSQKS